MGIIAPRKVDPSSEQDKAQRYPSITVQVLWFKIFFKGKVIICFTLRME